MEFFRTKRLILRNVEEKDIPIIYDYRNNEICARYQRGQVKKLEDIEKLVQNRKKDFISTESNTMISVALKDTDEMIGEINVMPNDGAISLGYTFSYKHHRKGYAFESLSALINELHYQYPEWEFISFTEPDNSASISLLKKLGYVNICYSEKLHSEVFGRWIKKI